MAIGDAGLAFFRDERCPFWLVRHPDRDLISAVNAHIAAGLNGGDPERGGCAHRWARYRRHGFFRATGAVRLMVAALGAIVLAVLDAADPDGGPRPCDPRALGRSGALRNTAPSPGRSALRGADPRRALGFLLADCASCRRAPERRRRAQLLTPAEYAESPQKLPWGRKVFSGYVFINE